MLFIIIIVFALLSWFVGRRLRTRFREYSEIPTSSGLSGAEIAAKMLRDNDIYDVEIVSVEGELTDHYNPKNKTINLSRGVYQGRNVAAAAVAAHETGHAVQHAHAYSFLKLRSAMVPLVNVSSQLMGVIFIVAMVGGFVFNFFREAFILVVAAQAVITLFSVVTLPVEFDASNRALAWLNSARITSGEEHEKASNALRWAASTYVVATLAAIAQLLYFVLAFSGSDD